MGIQTAIVRVSAAAIAAPTIHGIPIGAAPIIGAATIITRGATTTLLSMTVSVTIVTGILRFTPMHHRCVRLTPAMTAFRSFSRQPVL